MSKASVAQEPSMDEILASIRRIIETGEDRNAEAMRSPPGETAETTQSGLRPGSQLPRLSERFETRDTLAYVRSPNPVLTAAASAVAPSADEAASSTATGVPAFGADEDRLTADLEQELAATWGDPVPPASAAPEPEAVSPVSSAPTEDPTPMSDLPSFDRRPDVSTHDERPPEAADDRSGFQPANTDRPFSSSDDAYENVTLPLTSEATGTLVAASFNDLAQAIRSGELRSIETMAQEMLRPMLQEWLDDNLPRIVERLVRDEIERMSRGGRR